eukprot:jgi/Mesvir1/16046/Mv26466-RA.1
MSHAVLSLRAKGPQDAILTVSPDITFFKTVYPRHTNYAFEDTEVSISSGVCGFNRTIEFQLPKSGDLVCRTYVVIKLPALTEPKSSTPTLGEAWWKIFSPYYSDLGRILLKKIEFRIGGYTVEELTGEFLHVWDELTRLPDSSYVRTAPSEHGGDFDPLCPAHPGMKPAFVYVPLDFSFCNDNGSALPMIALQYHDARIRITTCTKDELFTRFVGGTEYSHLTVADSNGNPVPWDSTAVTAVAATTNTPAVVGMPAVGGAGYRDSMIAKFDDTLMKMTLVCRSKHVYVIPFCLDPESWKPTGSTNFSRLDSVKLQLKGLGTSLAPLLKGAISIYARSFNVLKITNGMGGLRFAS